MLLEYIWRPPVCAFRARNSYKYTRCLARPLSFQDLSLGYTYSYLEIKNASPRASSLLPGRFLLDFVSTRCYGCTKSSEWSISWRDVLLQLWPKTFWSMYWSPKLDLCQILATIGRSFFLFSWTMAVWIRGMDGTEFLSLLETSITTIVDPYQTSLCSYQLVFLLSTLLHYKGKLVSYCLYGRTMMVTWTI